MAFTFFFRDRHTLEQVRDLVLPEIKSRHHIDIWDAGCAMGPEPYTLAIILRESLGPYLFRNVRIFATDIDGSNRFGDIITNGVYHRSEMESVPGSVLNEFFEPSREDCFRVREEIRKALRFQCHDLLSLQPVREGFSLILCKNVLLHFTEEQRSAVIRMFHNALDDNGYFVMEQTQKLPEEVCGLFEPVSSGAQLFRKAVHA